MNGNALIVEKAREWIGVPFLHAGRTKKGVDCVGLIVGVARELRLGDKNGEPLERRDEKGYGRSGRAQRLVFALSDALCAVSEKEAKPGDVALFRIGAHAQHVGFLSTLEEGGASTVIHALENVGKVAEHRLCDSWRKRIVGIYRVNSLRALT
ncbi:MAG: NlpC/P60 family protein [Rickettsiales bacterium]